jgi:hypothetical protein
MQILSDHSIHKILYIANLISRYLVQSGIGFSESMSWTEQLFNGGFENPTKLQETKHGLPKRNLRLTPYRLKIRFLSIGTLKSWNSSPMGFAPCLFRGCGFVRHLRHCLTVNLLSFVGRFKEIFSTILPCHATSIVSAAAMII